MQIKVAEIARSQRPPLFPNKLNGSLKILFFICSLSFWSDSGAAESLNSDVQPEIASVRAHERHVEYLTRVTGNDGSDFLKTNSYVQLQTGLNRWDETLGAYVSASAAIELINGQ